MYECRYRYEARLKPLPPELLSIVVSVVPRDNASALRTLLPLRCFFVLLRALDLSEHTQSRSYPLANEHLYARGADSSH